MINQGDLKNIERRIRFDRPMLRKILERGDITWQNDLIKYGLSVAGSSVLLTSNNTEFVQIFNLFQKIDDGGIVNLTDKISAFEHQLQYLALIQQDTVFNRQTTPSLIINNAIEFISDNLYSHLTPRQIAKEVHVTSPYLNRLIKIARKQTTKQLIKEMKTQEGARLLSYSELPIHEIANLLKFSDSSHFSHAFKSLYHVPPTVYRRTHLYV